MSRAPATSAPLQPDVPPRTGLDWVRGLQLALGAIWVVDGLLQYQDYMFSSDFSASVLAGSAQGNPDWIASSILWSADIVDHSPVLINSAFATIQLGIGLAIAFRPTLRLGLAASTLWALLVWWFGEGLGLLLTGQASALSGAPGAVLLYAVLSVLLWPTLRHATADFVAAQPFGARTARIAWVVLWGGLAVLNLQPSQFDPDAVHDMVTGMADGQPGWLAFLMNEYAGLSDHHGVVLTLVGALVLALVAAGIYLPHRWTRITVICAVVAAGFIWVIGEALGAPFGGRSTDVNSGPLLALLALAYWPRKADVASTSTGALA